MAGDLFGLSAADRDVLLRMIARERANYSANVRNLAPVPREKNIWKPRDIRWFKLYEALAEKDKADAYPTEWNKEEEWWEAQEEAEKIVEIHSTAPGVTGKVGDYLPCWLNHKLSRWEVIAVPTTTGIPFRNDSGETVPAYAVMRVTGSATVDGTEYVTIAKPNYTFARKYLINLGSEVTNGQTGTGTWFDESKSQLVLYDEADGAPAGEEWGAWPGQWSLKKERLGFTLINGAAGRAIGVQREVVSLFGKFYEELEQGGSADFKIWMRYDGQKRDTQMIVDAYDWYLNKDETIAKNTQGELAWYSNKWHVRNAYCSEDDTDDAAGGMMAGMGSDGSGFPQVFVSVSTSGGYISPSAFQGFDL